MQIETIHTPERLPGEDQETYRARRRWSKFLGKQVTVVTAYPMRHRIDVARRMRRESIRAIGFRQYKKRLRAMKEAA